MTLDANEFIRRFLIHVLPGGFHRIRHYGLFPPFASSRPGPQGFDPKAAVPARALGE
jgi:hypothetical protein